MRSTSCDRLRPTTTRDSSCGSTRAARGAAPGPLIVRCGRRSFRCWPPAQAGERDGWQPLAELSYLPAIDFAPRRSGNGLHHIPALWYLVRSQTPARPFVQANQYIVRLRFENDGHADVLTVQRIRDGKRAYVDGLLELLYDVVDIGGI